MTNLPAQSRAALAEKFYISGLKAVKEVVSRDGTRKFLLALQDGQKIESVFIPSRRTNTVCVSSQAGCKFACAFCASGKGGFVRDLNPAEMVNQVLFVRARGINVTNAVFMGMGEPFDNYSSVLKAVRLLNAPYGLGMGQRRITISTSGVIPGIKKLADEHLQVELSVSLHTADDKTRSRLMLVNKRYPLAELIKACADYAKKTRRQVTFEYVLIKEVNDSAGDAAALAGLLKDIGNLAKVNLITFNAVENFGFMPSEEKVVRGFKAALEERKVLSTVRASRGADIEAACGQLRMRAARR
jgi:23S rRNA (adenine2503-C2)-methyltransferase